jgi:hypothetical protein
VPDENPAVGQPLTKSGRETWDAGAELSLLDVSPYSDMRRSWMGRIVVNNSLTLDGVMQAPGRPDEDRRGGFEHGGWAQPLLR